MAISCLYVETQEWLPTVTLVADTRAGQELQTRFRRPGTASQTLVRVQADSACLIPLGTLAVEDPSLGYNGV
jgi:hypothetical protein